MYYRGADAAILVFDITDPKSFLNCKKWVQGRLMLDTYIHYSDM